MGVLMLIELGLNIAGIKIVALLNQVSVWWHIGIVAVVVVLVFVAGKPDQSGPDLVRDPAQDVAGSWHNAVGLAHGIDYGAGDHLPAVLAFFFSLLQAQLDVHRATTPRPTWPRRPSAPASRARGACSCRSPSRRSSATSSCVALTTHLPNLSTLFPATLGRRSRRAPASTTSATASPSSASSSTTSARAHPARCDLLPAGIAIAMAFCGLSSVAVGRPDALRVQPR